MVEAILIKTCLKPPLENRFSNNNKNAPNSVYRQIQTHSSPIHNTLFLRRGLKNVWVF